MQNELRKSIDTENWSVISSIVPSTVGCMLCPAVEVPEQDKKLEETFSIKEEKTGAWLTRSVLDPYPYTHPMKFKLKEKREFGQKYNAHGWSEIVIETRDHNKELNDLNADEIKNILLVYKNRLAELSQRESVEYVSITKDNLHVEFDHAYSKITTLPIVPQKIKEKMQKFHDYQFKNESCLYCDLIKNGAESRTVLENDYFVALIPFSPHLSFQIDIFPKKHHMTLETLSDFEIFSLAETIKGILTRLKGAIKPFKFVLSFQLKPIKEEDFHFHVEIAQKTYHDSLYESYGLNLIKTSPEETAKILRG